MQPQQPRQTPPPRVPNQPTHSEDEDYAAASYSAANYAEQIRAKRPTSKHSWRWLIVVLALVIVGVGVYWFLNRPKTVTPKTSTQSSTQKVTSSASTIDSTVKMYTSTQFAGLSFNYPANWKVAEANGMLTATSPALSLKDASGKMQGVAVVYKIRDKQQALPEFDKGNALAIIESQKIAYAKPSGTQRAQTYISFLQYASSATAGLDGIYVTGDTGYQAQQAIPKADFTPVDPVISLTFVKCVSGSASCLPTTQAVSLAAADWAAATLSGPLTTMLESLIVQ